jgi:lysophospholipase L1-like esterase
MQTPRRFFLLGALACTVALLLTLTTTAAEKSGKAGKAKTAAAKGPERWEETIKRFEAADAATPPPKGAVLLVGGSNARRWTDVADYFPQQKVINRGFGGALLADVLHFTDRIVIPYAPRVIVLNAGGNDLAAGKSPEDVRDAARAFAKKVHAALPDTRIISISVPPVLRSASAPESLSAIRRTNALLAALAREEPSLSFIDLFPAFADAEGKTRPDLFVEDGTHFSPKGYAIVAGLLREKL